jgi:hypothetical protein
MPRAATIAETRLPGGNAALGPRFAGGSPEAAKVPLGLTDHHGMMTTPRWTDPDSNDDRVPGGSSGLGASHWSTARAVSERHVDEITRRLRTGAYDTPQAVDALARRLIDSGEL